MRAAVPFVGMAGDPSSWHAFSAFQVFGDHVPMDGFSLVVRIKADPHLVNRLVETRAGSQPPLDPQLALMMLRAGVGLITTGRASFVYANLEETIVVLRREVVREVGQSLEVHDHLIAAWAARMALLSGASLPVSGQVYEFPDAAVVRKALRACIDSLEQGTPARSAQRLGVQMRGRGEPFHASMVETIEEQTSLLEAHGVDMETLPGWWWRGVAARLSNVSAGEVELWSELPSTDEFVGLIS